MTPLRGLDRGPKAALLISECQRSMTDPSDSAAEALNQQVQERAILSKIASLAQSCRELSVPVVHCIIAALAGFRGFPKTCLLSNTMLKGAALVKGHSKAAIAPELTPQAGDIASQRCHGMTAFHGTAESHTFQLKNHLPFVATLTNATNITRILRMRTSP